MDAPIRGFVLGKFLPPHAGHVFLCRSAASMVDEMTVLVCSTDAEPIPGHLRADWMRALLPDLNIVHMHRDIPQAPEDHPDFWPIWKAAIEEHHPEPVNRVFGSEPYVFRLAAELSAQPVLIDPDREVFAVSSTAVRDNPAGNWQFIPGAVRPYYQKRVCFLGPESSGKSTLAAAMAERFSTLHMPEYGRIYDARYRQGAGWKASDFVAIAQTHVAMRDTLAQAAGPLFFEDTDPLQTLVWAEHLLGHVPDDLAVYFESVSPADLYILLSPEAGWQDDGTRYSGDPDTRRWFHQRCLEHLRERRLEYAEVDGSDWSDRAAQAENLVTVFQDGATQVQGR